MSSAQFRWSSGCDGYKPQIDRVRKLNPGTELAGYVDYRKMIDEAKLDAVVIATPDQHHVQATLLACRAGLDVYCEKPLSLTIGEGRRLVEAVRRFGRVLQVGSQQRSMEMDRFACRFVREGGIGKVSKVVVKNFPGPLRYDNPPDPAVAAIWRGKGIVAKPHLQNWLDCIKTREDPNAPVEVGHRSITICHLASVARELVRKLRWDPSAETFPDDEEARALIDRPRRKGWELPDLS